jgi:hypothetical protein
MAAFNLYSYPEIDYLTLYTSRGQGVMHSTPHHFFSKTLYDSRVRSILSVQNFKDVTLIEHCWFSSLYITHSAIVSSTPCT